MSFFSQFYFLCVFTCLSHSPIFITTVSYGFIWMIKTSDKYYLLIFDAEITSLEKEYVIRIRKIQIHHFDVKITNLKNWYSFVFQKCNLKYLIWSHTWAVVTLVTTNVHVQWKQVLQLYDVFWYFCPETYFSIDYANRLYNYFDMQY